MSTSTTINKKLFTDLPYPLATAWDRVLRTSSSTDQVRQIKAMLEIYLRYTSGILLAAYLRESPKSAIESILPSLSSPANGHYCALIREILRYFREIQQESETPHFFTHAIDWYWDAKSRKPKPTAEAKRLDRFISFRNEDTHDLIKTENELYGEVPEVLQDLQQLLYHSKWLAGYSLFRISNARRRRGGGEDGQVHFYKGKVLPLPQSSIWSCVLYPEVMYLVSPNGSEVLEVDPFLVSEMIGRKEEVSLWVSTPNMRRIDLRNDNTGYKTKRTPMIGDDNLQWKDWLESRSQLEPIQSNEYPTDFLDAHFQDVGSVIDDHYRILRHLGEGGMATVYEVYDQVMEENLALKILHLEQVDTKIKDRTKKEFKFMQSLNHANILPVKSIDFLSDGRIAIGMPLMEGTLKDYMEDSTVTEELVCSWGRDLLSALDYLHTLPEPIYHRDIKPSNVLYDSEGQIYIADFGIARQEGDVRLTRTAEQMGSVPYMAPETLRGGEANESTDRYSLAVTLHELRVGKLPKKVGHGIEGPLGEVLQRLGSSEPEERLAVSVADFDLPVEVEDIEQEDNAMDISTMRTIRRGLKGSDVRKCQELLVQHGYEIGIDGHFGKGTRDALVDFQRLRGLDVDGIVGQDTWSALFDFEELAEEPIEDVADTEVSEEPSTNVDDEIVVDDILAEDEDVQASESVEASEVLESEGAEADDLPSQQDERSDLDDTQQESVDSNSNEPVQSQTSEVEPSQAESFWAKSHLPWLVIAPIVGYRLIEILAVKTIFPGGTVTNLMSLLGLTTPSYPSVNIISRLVFLESNTMLYALRTESFVLYLVISALFVVILKILLSHRVSKFAIATILLFGCLDVFGLWMLRANDGFQVYPTDGGDLSKFATYDISKTRFHMMNPNDFLFPWFMYVVILIRTAFYAFICHKIGQAVSSKKTES